MADTVTPELARAWERYFRRRGGQSPTVAPDVLPVVIIDDDSKGPYPPHRVWYAFISVPATVGFLSIAAIRNNDLVTQSSVVVIDRIWVQTAAGTFAMAVATASALPLTATSPADDCNQEKDQGPVARPQIGNVVVGQCITLAAFPSSGFPNPDAVTKEIVGPWILGPQAEFGVSTGPANTAILVAFRGRYYPDI